MTLRRPLSSDSSLETFSFSVDFPAVLAFADELRVVGAGYVPTTFALQLITDRRQSSESFPIYAIRAAWIDGRHNAEDKLCRARGTSEQR